MIHTRVYRDGVLTERDCEPHRISEFLSEPDTVVWMDVRQPESDEMQLIADEVGLNPLAVEDAVTGHQRPKVDRYDDHVFIVVYAVDMDWERAELHLHEVNAFVGQRYLITVRKGPIEGATQVLERWDENADLAKNGVSFLLWGLLDVVVDSYFSHIERLDDEIEVLEDRLFADEPPDREMSRRNYRLRNSLVGLRRVILPMREVVNTVMRRDLGFVTQQMQPYYLDVYDHVLRATEWVDSLRDIVSNIHDTALTIQDYRLNQIMKKLTSWAAIIAVPTAVTGYFGMNVPYPGYGKPWGFVVSAVVIVGLGVGLWAAFRRRGWL